MGLPPKTCAAHYFDGTEPGPDGLMALAQRALELRDGSSPRRCDGLRLGAVFFNPSLRTRTSLEAAAVALGIHPMIIQPGKDAWGWAFEDGAIMDGGQAEHVRDAVPVLSSYVDLLAVRSFARLIDPEEDRAEPVLGAFMGLSSRPVLNLESCRWHPMQGLADAATWVSRLGPLRGKRLALSWAPHPKPLPAAVPNQVLLTASMLGMDITLAHPEGFDLDPQIVGRATGLARVGGGALTVSHSPDAAAGADVVYAKSWSGFSGYGDRVGEAVRRAACADWMMTRERVGGAGFMHCLPVRRNVVVEDSVLDGPRSWVTEQAGLRMWTAMALLEHLGRGGTW